MHFLDPSCDPQNLIFLGVGDYAASYIGEAYPIIHSEEEIDRYESSSLLCLVADGSGLADLVLLTRLLDRCKAEEVFVIIANPAPPELIKAIKHKCSCIFTLGSEDAETGVFPLMDLVAHMLVSPRLLELDTAELRTTFDPTHTVVHHSLRYEEIDPQAFERDVNALEMARHAWPAMISVLLSPSDDMLNIDELITPLLCLMPQDTHFTVLWNIYLSESAQPGGMRVEILRSKPAPHTMEMIKEINKQLS